MQQSSISSSLSPLGNRVMRIQPSAAQQPNIPISQVAATRDNLNKSQNIANSNAYAP